MTKFIKKVTVFLDDKEVPESDVAYAGPAPGAVHGVWQVNLRIPRDSRPGSKLSVVVRFGTVLTQPGVTVSVRP